MAVRGGGWVLAGLVAAVVAAGSAAEAGAEPGGVRATGGADRHVQALIRDPGRAPDLPDAVAPAALARIYAARDDAPFWLADDARPARRLLAVLRDAERDGLDPSDYRPADLAERLRTARTARQRARLELELSAALLRYAAHLRAGRPAARAAASGGRGQPAALDPAALLPGAARAPALDLYLARFAPAHRGYRALRERLHLYQGLRDAGGWPRVPGDRLLEPGMAGADVTALNRRLAAGGDLAGYDPEPARFDAETEAAVRRFQRRHGLLADGAAGANTRAALNVSAAERVRQIEIAMERWRWLPADLGRRHVRVNLAGYRTSLVEDGAIALSMESIVGMVARQTPNFSDRITYLEFNPTWTIPSNLLRQDILPKLRRDPGYLRRNDMTLYSGWDANARAVDARAIDWHRPAASFRGYRIVQAPGPANPLGRVKFMFPNRHHVYMHDTPATWLFERDQKTFSSGCIRIAEPLALAEALLADKPGWDRARMQRTIDSGRRIRVPLPSPVPVHTVYFTAWVDAAGAVHFARDVYGRDAAVRQALAGRPSS